MAGKINSRSKGNRYERVIAKWFQDWTGYEFGRVPGSGSIRWKKTDNITGDITCTDDKHSRRFPFSIECKSYQDIKFEHLILGNKNVKILDFWEQACNDATRANKIPLLFMKYNSMAKNESFVVIGEDLLDHVKALSKKPHMIVYLPEQRIGIFMATDIIGMEYLDLYKVARKAIKR